MQGVHDSPRGPSVDVGRCKWCEAFIGFAVGAHEDHCELRSQPEEKQHDTDKAARGECECPLCVANRMIPGGYLG